MQLLTSFDCGTFEFEPIGQRSPDFGLDDRIAVEVTRLTKAVDINGDHVVIDSDEVAIRQIVRTVISEFNGTQSNQSAIVNYRFTRPVQRQDLRQGLKDFLDNVLQQEIVETQSTEVCTCLWVDLRPATHRPGMPFLEGGSSDGDRPGWLVPDMVDNVSRIAAVKQHRAMDVKNKYTEWWLLLENRLSYRLPAEALNAFHGSVDPNEFWTKCVAFDTRDPLQYQVFWDLSNQHS